MFGHDGREQISGGEAFGSDSSCFFRAISVSRAALWKNVVIEFVVSVQKTETTMKERE